MDTVETAASFGLELSPETITWDLLEQQFTGTPYQESDFSKIINAFVPVTFAVNSFNRGMGIADVYPFVIAPVVQQKLTFIHDLVVAKK